MKLLPIAVMLSTGIVFPAVAQLMPTNGLPLYSVYREKLIKEGWKPKPGPIKNYAGRGWSEFICGNAVCGGTFTSPKDTRTLRITIWMKHGLDVNDTEYYVAPEFDIRPVGE